MKYRHSAHPRNRLHGRLVSILTLTLALIFTAQIPVAAFKRPAERRSDAYRGISFSDGFCSAVSTVGQSELEATPQQIENAKAIMGIAKTLQLGEKGALIGLMVGLAKSNLKNLANAGDFKTEEGTYPYKDT